MREDAIRSFEVFFDRGWYILGEQVKQFEAEYAKFNHTNYCVGVANGLDAIILALKVLGVGQGDEVIVPSNTYIATWLAVSNVGATPVPVEPDITTLNIDPRRIEEKITPRTRAIIPVHLYGQCCEMDAIMQIAEKHGLFVIEDNAQSQGASFNGKQTGTFGQVNATSFYPGKNLGALGDAGAVTTDSDELDHKLRVLRNYGSQKKYYNEVMGVNSRLDELQAGMLSLRLKYLGDWNEERKNLAAQYASKLGDIEQLTLPYIAPGATSVYHQFIVRTNERGALKQHLLEQGVETLIHYPVPPHLQEAYANLNYTKGSFPIAEQISETCLSLPVYPGLTEEEIDHVCQAIHSFQFTSTPKTTASL